VELLVEEKRKVFPVFCWRSIFSCFSLGVSFHCQPLARRSPFTCSGFLKRKVRTGRTTDSRPVRGAWQSPCRTVGNTPCSRIIDSYIQLIINFTILAATQLLSRLAPQPTLITEKLTTPTYVTTQGISIIELAPRNDYRD